MEMKNTLIITNCSKNKVKTKKKIPAIDLYQGKLFLLIKSISEKFNTNLLILSAKYGLLKSLHKVSYYEKVLTSKRAKVLKLQIEPKLKTYLIDNKIENVIVIMSPKYESIVIPTFEDHSGLRVLFYYKGYYDTIYLLRNIIINNELDSDFRDFYNLVREK